MIEGVTILSKEMIMEPDMRLSFIIFIFSILIIGTGVFISCLYHHIDSRGVTIGCIITAIGIIVYIVSLRLPAEVESGRYQYKATIEKSVSFNEVYEKYNVIEQDGNLWILEDKEYE